MTRLADGYALVCVSTQGKAVLSEEVITAADMKSIVLSKLERLVEETSY